MGKYKDKYLKERKELVKRARLAIRWTRDWCDADLIAYAKIENSERLDSKMEVKTAKKIIDHAKKLGHFCWHDFLCALKRGEIKL